MASRRSRAAFQKNSVRGFGAGIGASTVSAIQVSLLVD
jgi:hypothetical protein